MPTEHATYGHKIEKLEAEIERLQTMRQGLEDQQREDQVEIERIRTENELIKAEWKEAFGAPWPNRPLVEDA